MDYSWNPGRLAKNLKLRTLTSEGFGQQVVLGTGPSITEARRSSHCNATQMEKRPRLGGVPSPVQVGRAGGGTVM